MPKRKKAETTSATEKQGEAKPLDKNVFKKLLEEKPKGKQRKNTRKTAPDPRLDPNIDPKRAKRIIANRESAARSKAKQKQHLENLKNMHKALNLQKTSIQQEIDSVHADARRVEKENEELLKRLQDYRAKEGVVEEAS
ncbi:BZIP domain-containing protein [Chloropicon primus]|uniref:BZIP domain-containing protein n=1 Tax=Chloropicon primus TaxID=1764295 RepID=A0A5B8MFM5_9CHLO|nr:hypothetical protein A3770_01p06480 [Chloropicon primus]UPQ97342.1 BZIP domain-containing protein [Chloropicon primus]|eukprot:QDZ18130.1 hypothetical protein A3770_01p06480 [Chloropicon primus]